MYRGSGLDVRYGLVEGPLAIAPRARVLVRDIEPWKPAVTLGAQLRWTRGRYAIAGDPYLQLGLANTDEGNRAALFLPLSFAVQPTPRWAVALDTGWHGEFAVLRDGWHIPVALGTRVRATDRLEVGATVGFASLLGPQNTPKQRVLFYVLGWR